MKVISWLAERPSVSEGLCSTVSDSQSLVYSQELPGLALRGCDQKFPDWIDNEINNKKQYKGLWWQNSLDWLTE
jgi:hypothetical protein